MGERCPSVLNIVQKVIRDFKNTLAHDILMGSAKQHCVNLCAWDG